MGTLFISMNIHQRAARKQGSLMHYSNSNFGLNTKMRVRYGLTLDRNRCYQWPLKVDFP